MESTKTRSPKWHRDELILTLDLYFKKDLGSITASNPKIIELSALLNRLPIHKNRLDHVKFRNANGVTLKMSNFLAIDPSYQGKGMTSYSKLDEQVFFEFYEHREELVRIADKLRHIDSDKNLLLSLNNIEEEDVFVLEGKTLFKLHKFRERNKEIVKKKKESVLKSKGALKCEICQFDFFESYGNLGLGYIECHHTKPLFELNTERKTTLTDLSLLCSNCHRMVHKDLSLSIIDFKEKYFKSSNN